MCVRMGEGRGNPEPGCEDLNESVFGEKTGDPGFILYSQ